MQRVNIVVVGVFGLMLGGACEAPEDEDAFAEDDELALRAGEGDAVVEPEAGWYRIHTRYNGECLDIEGNSGNDGALIINWPCHYGNNQRVKFESAGAGWYRLKFKHSGKYLTVPGNSSQNGWKLRQYPATGGDEQLFRLAPQADGTFRIFTRHEKPLSMITHGTDYVVYDDSDEYLTQYHGDPGVLYPSGAGFLRSFFWVDLIEPAAPWPSWTSKPGQWGYSDRRWAVDFNGDGRADYCRAVGNSSGANSWLGCAITTASGLTDGITMWAAVADWGHAGRRWMVDFNGDGKADFCRAVGDSSGANSWLGCSFSTGSGLAAPISIWAPVADWGYADRRWMIDFNGDGKADFCRAVGAQNNSWLGCTFSNGTTFTASVDIWATVGDWGFSDRRWMADFNGDGKVDYCRATGASSGPGSFLTCSLSNGAGFGGTVSTPIADWGHAGRRWMADVNGDGRADFCRAVGESSGGFSWLGCAYSTGAGFNNDIDVWIPMPDWGGDADRRFMADVNGDGRVDLGHARGADPNVLVFELL